MVTQAGILNEQRLQAGDPVGKPITSIVLGTGNAPVTGLETALTGQIAKTILSYNYLGGGYLQYNAQIDAGDAAIQIQEMGLINSAGVLCYRVLVTPVQTVSGIVYSLGYKIKMS